MEQVWTEGGRTSSPSALGQVRRSFPVRRVSSVGSVRSNSHFLRSIPSALRSRASYISIVSPLRPPRPLRQSFRSSFAASAFPASKLLPGHIYCGHQSAHPEGFWPDRAGTLTKQQREMVAEAVAYLVCKRLELMTRSALYLRRYVTAENLCAISKRLIIEATNRIEARS